MSSRFDDVAERLGEVPRLYFEPDGSLVWVGDDWQIDGMLYDREGLLQYADLKGQAPWGRWRQLVERITYPTYPPPITKTIPPASVLHLTDRSLHDLQTFEKLLWGEAAASDGSITSD
jgi:hypothetical protein